MTKIVIICGATATGKTALSIELASMFKGAVLNFDSLSLYQELNIGTAKPTAQERAQVPHYLFDLVSAKTSINASDYRLKALEVINQIKEQYQVLILVGGSGFYLQALLKGMYASPTTPKEIIKKSEDLFLKQGIEPFREILKEYDFKSFEKYHPNDHYRIRRAVEHWWSHQTPFSNLRLSHQAQTPPDWEIAPFFLDIPKEDHWSIIQKRTQSMFDLGWVEEVQNLLESGFTGNEKPLQSVGYKQMIQYLKQEISKIECTEQINIANRQLAKSQRTWFKREYQERYHPVMDRQKIISACQKFMDSE